jgi:hypothetical protein
MISWYLYRVNVNSDIIVKRLIKMADKLLVSSYDEEIFNSVNDEEISFHSIQLFVITTFLQL